MATGHRTIETSNRQLRRGDPKTKFFVHLTVFLLVNAGLMTLNLTRNPDKLWFLWVVFGWGLGVIFHGIRAFNKSSDT